MDEVHSSGRASTARLARRAALAAASLVVAVGLAELLVRAVAPQRTYSSIRASSARMFRTSDLLPSELVPGFRGSIRQPEYVTAVAINSSGLRGPELARPKTDPRILVLGDSFTFGLGVEDREAYPARLEAILRARGCAAEVANAGFASGFYPDTYYLFLKERAPALAPDVVVVGFFLGNDVDYRDLGENVWTRRDEAGLPLRIGNMRSEVEEGYFVLRNRLRRFATPVLRDSHLYQLGYSFFNGGLPLHPRGAAFARVTANAWMYRSTYAGRTERAVARVERLFLAMQETATSRGLPLVVAMIAAREQVDPAAAPDGADVEKPQRIFGAFFREHGIPYVDLTPALRAAGGGSLYFDSDLHWRASGHEIAATALADYLANEGVLDECGAGEGVLLPDRR